MSASISSACFYVGLLMLHIVSAQHILTRFTFPLTSRSKNGSSATGHCTGATRLSDRYQCNDPTSSVVYDGHIPTLTGLDGNMWASQLLTINASSAVLVFDFTGTQNFQVRRAEIVVFNCPQWRITVQSVRLTDSDLTQLGDASPTLSSCDSLVRFCIPNLNIRSSQAVLRLEFTTHEPTDWIHIAEVGFYRNSRTCPPEILVTEPTAATTTATTSNTTADTTARDTSDGMNQEVVTSEAGNSENSAAMAAGVTAGVLFFIMASIGVTIIATAIICLKTKRRKVCWENKELRSDFLKTTDTEDMDNKTDMDGTADGKGSMYDVILHNRSGCVQSQVNQDGTYNQLGGPERNKPNAHVDEAHEAYSQLEHSSWRGAGKLSSVSKEDSLSVSDQTQMYAVVNKPKRHKPPSQPTQPPAQEYAVVNKHTKKNKPRSRTAQPPEQEYAVVNKHRSRE